MSYYTIPQFWQVMESKDPKDKLICELIKSLSTHPDFKDSTSSLVYQLHRHYANLPSMIENNSIPPEGRRLF